MKNRRTNKERIQGKQGIVQKGRKNVRMWDWWGGQLALIRRRGFTGGEKEKSKKRKNKLIQKKKLVNSN